MLLKRKCPVCGEDHGEAVRRIPLNISTEMREKTGYPHYYDIVSCEKCGMLFADSELTKEEVDNYYINCNMYDNIGDVKKDVYDEGCEMYYSAIKPYLTPKAHIIDIGCGNGRFLKFLQRKGYRYLYGMDPSERSIEKLRASRIMGGAVGSAYDEVPKEYEGKFDIVICSFVFEHLLMPAVCLNNIIKLLSGNGVLYLAVPDAGGYEKYLRQVPNYFNQEHINYFTVKTLDYLCARNGLKRCSPEEECHHVMCPASPEMAISAVYCVGDFDIAKVQRDESGVKSARAYFQKIEREQQREKATVRALLEKEKSIIIWGTGGFASSLIHEMPEVLERVLCFVDNDINKQKSSFFGKSVLPPEALKQYPEIKVMVCVMMNSRNIEEQMKAMNLTNDIICLC